MAEYYIAPDLSGRSLDPMAAAARGAPAHVPMPHAVSPSTVASYCLPCRPSLSPEAALVLFVLLATITRFGR